MGHPHSGHWLCPAPGAKQRLERIRAWTVRLACGGPCGPRRAAGVVLGDLVLRAQDRLARAECRWESPVQPPKGGRVGVCLLAPVSKGPGSQRGRTDPVGTEAVAPSLSGGSERRDLQTGRCELTAHPQPTPHCCIRHPGSCLDDVPLPSGWRTRIRVCTCFLASSLDSGGPAGTRRPPSAQAESRSSRGSF